MDLLNLYARIVLDPSDYESGLDDATRSTHTFGETLKKGLATAAKVGTAAITAASAAIGVLTKQSIDGYAEYEQLAGGVETLFKDSADTVMQYANNAYQTAGLSANQYMETVTSFSASLLQSLGGDTEKAAQVADMAITDMSDNANKMGTSMESIQNAYNGFAKANYTMLDNLKLGYGGTKAEMERLLKDAQKLSGQKFDLSSYSDIVKAIHVIQESMDITGTTAKEASTTIQGSVAAAKSAWTNLVTGIADENADLDTLIGNFVSSVETAAGNIIPRLTQILGGMGVAVQQIAPVLAEQVPALVTSVLPSMVSAGSQLLVGLITGIVNALPGLVSAVPEIIGTIVSAVSDSLPAIMAAGGELLDMLVTGISDNLPVLIPAAVGLILDFVTWLTEPENQGELANGAISILNALADGIINSIGILFDKGPEIVQNIADGISENAPKMWDAAARIIDELGDKLAEEIPGLSTVFENLEAVVAAVTAAFVAFKAATAISSIIETLTNVTNLQTIAQAALNAVMNANPFVLVATLVAGLVAALVTLYNTNEEVRNAINAAWNSVKDTISNVVSAISEFFTVTIPNAAQSALDWFTSIPEKMKEVGVNVINGFWNGIQKKADWLKEQVTGFFSGIVDGVKDFLGIRSPSRLFREEIGQYIALGVAEGISDKSNKAVKAADKMAKDVYSRSKDWADKQTKYLELSYEEQAELWETIQSQFVEGSKQYADAEEQVFDLRKKALDEYEKSVEDYQRELDRETNKILNWYSLFDEVPQQEKVSGDQLLKNLQSQVDNISGFFEKLSNLGEREGVGHSLVDEIKRMGPKAMDELDALLALSDEKLTEYAALFEEKTNMASQYAAANLGGYGTANVDFASSAVGQSSAAMINSMGGGDNKNVPVIPLTINLLTGDARPFAEWILPDLISFAKTNGTPITDGMRYA